MKKKRQRDFHRQVRVVYRACRRLYGIEKTQDECLRIFKVVFPERFKLTQSEETMASIPIDVRNKLYTITQSWQPSGELKNVIDRADSWLQIPMECEREDLIQFYDDIMPVVMRIRKLTPREVFRLMGVNEKDIDTILASGISQSSAYKLAGNSIVAGGNFEDEDGNVDGVLYNLFRKMFIDTEEETHAGKQLSLF